jgi:hypothetical protein
VSGGRGGVRLDGAAGRPERPARERGSGDRGENPGEGRAAREQPAVGPCQPAQSGVAGAGCVAGVGHWGPGVGWQGYEVSLPTLHKLELKDG